MRQMLYKPNAAAQCNVPHSTQDAHRYSLLVNNCISDLSSNESRAFGIGLGEGNNPLELAGFAKPADGVEPAPSFFEVVQEQLGLKPVNRDHGDCMLALGP